jgi:hypothetical protein
VATLKAARAPPRFFAPRCHRHAQAVFGEEEGVPVASYDGFDPHSKELSSTRVFAPERRTVSFLYWETARQGPMPEGRARAKAALEDVKVF